MKIFILTLFPEILESVFSKSIIKRAIDKKQISVKNVNIRSWGLGPRKVVDDKPYGGGEGMIMMPDPIVNALSTLKPSPYTVLLSPNGKKYTQSDAVRLSKKKSLALICGHYEGVDARVEDYVDEVISIGNYVLTGGELPAAIIVDSLTRLIPGVIKKESLQNESFSEIENSKFKIKNFLEYPQYTRPEAFKGKKVPQVLLSGNHAQIAKWRQEQSIKRTKKYQPELLKKNS